MDDSKLVSSWVDYLACDVDRAIAADDDMFKKAVHGWADYNLVAKTATKLIFSVLCNALCQDVRRVLDFGCGHGRVARHLRTMFPSAKLFFTDIEESLSPRRPTCKIRLA